MYLCALLSSARLHARYAGATAGFGSALRDQRPLSGARAPFAPSCPGAPSCALRQSAVPATAKHDSQLEGGCGRDRGDGAYLRFAQLARSVADVFAVLLAQSFRAIVRIEERDETKALQKKRQAQSHFRGGTELRRARRSKVPWTCWCAYLEQLSPWRATRTFRRVGGVGGGGVRGRVICTERQARSRARSRAYW